MCGMCVVKVELVRGESCVCVANVNTCFNNT